MKYILSTLLVVTPLIAHGQTPRNLQDLIDIIFGLLQSLIPLIFGIAFIGFLWGAAQFILHADDPGKRKEGTRAMLYGVIALFVMLSIWGLVAILSNTFGVTTGSPFLPGVIR